MFFISLLHNFYYFPPSYTTTHSLCHSSRPIWKRDVVVTEVYFGLLVREACERGHARVHCHARSGQSIVSVLEVVYTLYTASISTISMPYYQRGQKVWPYFSFMKELNWLTVEKLIYLRSATLAFKCMTGSAPDYLTYKMTDVSTTCAVVIFRVLLSQLNSRLLLVKLSQAKLTTREWQFE